MLITEQTHEKILFILGLAFVVSFSVQAQGLQLVYVVDFYKELPTNKCRGRASVFEFIGATRCQGVNLPVLHERQNSLGGVEGLYYFYRFGSFI
ncbi:MAG: hypothetical protein ACP5DZ_02880 [Bacteroidales bacterium]